MNNKAIWIIFILLFFLHQDFWNWSDQSLVFGFMPVGLAYHAAFSIVAAMLWAAAVKWAWPSDIEAWADADDEQPATDGGTA
ncbi:MAG: hypothetical protein KTR15_00515 [Phycisphaeraceae bacterium]|nr:hypothetical protein [Phycisphaeraceae bacterium]